MTGLLAPTAATGGRRRGDAVLWGVSFLAVLLLHAGLLMAAILWFPSFDQPSLPTAAMIVELAPLAAPPVPTTEMAPGIEQQAARTIEQKIDKEVEPKSEPVGTEVETCRFEPKPKSKPEPGPKPKPEIEKAETLSPEARFQKMEAPTVPSEKPDEERRPVKSVEEKVTPIAKHEPMVKKAEVVLPTPRPEPPRPKPASEKVEAPPPDEDVVPEPVTAPIVDEAAIDAWRSKSPDDTEIAEEDDYEPSAGKVAETPHVPEPPPVVTNIQEAAPSEKTVERTTAPVTAPAPPANRMAAPTPGLSSTVSRNAVLTWQGLLRLHLERHKRYPTAAQFHRQEGTSIVRFAMTREGRVTRIRLERSSGFSRLDDEAVALPERAQPLPPPPPAISGKQIEIVVPIRFFLK